MNLDYTGLIPILGGIYGFLLGKGILPRQPRDPEKMELWRQKFGPLMMVLGPVLVVFGFLELFRVF